MTSGRWIIALGYLAATLAAQVAHHHGPTGHALPHAQAGCDDPGVHWAAHTDTPDLSQPADACGACHFRAAPSYVPEAGPPTPARIVQAMIEPAAADGPARPYLPISSRGPPRGL
jgi:hypothetical protein